MHAATEVVASPLHNLAAVHGDPHAEADAAALVRESTLDLDRTRNRGVRVLEHCEEAVTELANLAAAVRVKLLA